jgi:hypothetical protein
MINETLAVPLAATSATLVSTMFGYPFDTIKTKMQVGNYKSSLECITLTASKEGIRGFYYGAGPVFISTAFFRSITFSIYHNCKIWLSQFSYTNSDHESIQRVSSGLLSGSVVAIISAPLEFIKILRQTETLSNSPNKPHKTLWGWTKQIHSQKGFRGFYNGLNLQMIRDSCGTAIYFFGYETCKDLYKSENETVPWWMLSLSGGLAGSLVWITLFPIDL